MLRQWSYSQLHRVVTACDTAENVADSAAVHNRSVNRVECAKQTLAAMKLAASGGTLDHCRHDGVGCGQDQGGSTRVLRSSGGSNVCLLMARSNVDSSRAEVRNAVCVGAAGAIAVRSGVQHSCEAPSDVFTRMAPSDADCSHLVSCGCGTNSHNGDECIEVVRSTAAVLK